MAAVWNVLNNLGLPLTIGLAAALLVGTLFVFNRLITDEKFRRGTQRTTWLLIGAWALSLGSLTLSGLADQSSRVVNVILFRSLISPVGGVDWSQLLGNILLFVPLGALLPLVLSRLRLVGVVAIAFGVSLFVETAQYWLATGRMADINDLILNIMGAVGGFFVFRITLKVEGGGHARGAKASKFVGVRKAHN